jgi:hypothetical protein
LTKLHLAIQMTRLMFPYLIFIGLTAYSAAVLYTFRSFVAPSFSPCFLNMHEGLERETYPKWREIYPQVCEEYHQGERFTVLKANQIGYSHTPANHDVANDHLTKIKAMLAGVGA